jgi:hypothetical protein
VPAFTVFLATQRHAAARGRPALIDTAMLARPPIAWGRGAVSTTSQIGGSIGVAGFGSLYLAAAGGHAAGHAFALTTLAFGATALVATIPACLAMRLPVWRRPGRPVDDGLPPNRAAPGVQPAGRR